MAEHGSRTRSRFGWLLAAPGLLIRRVVPARLVHLVESFWVVPLGIALVGILAPLTFQLIPEDQLTIFFGGEEPEIDIAGARATLQVVAGGVITIMSLVFSLAFVALSITAQQLSPRILDYVVEDRVTQVLVGLALATFLFSAITLSFGITGGEVRLASSAFIALTMATGTLTTVVIFSHKMTRIMRAEDIVAKLGDAYFEAIRLGPSSIDEQMMVDKAEAEHDLERQLAEAPAVRASRTGYLGAVDHPGLVGWATERNLKLEILWRENAFVLEGVAVVKVAGHDGDVQDLSREITDYLNLTDRRAIGETAEYEASSLCEAAVRALSPGINDPATARSCANRLFQGLVLMAALPEKPRALKGRDGVARLLRARHGIAQFLEHAVAPILEAARDRATVRHLAGLADTLDSIATRPKEHDAVQAFKARIDESDPPPERYLKERGRAGTAGAKP